MNGLKQGADAMTMTPDELRALADALEPMAKAPRFEDFDVPAFCAWVRACADPKPVAWQYRWKGSRELHYTLSDPAERDTQEIIDVQPLYSAPASPQAEPKREPNPDEVICPACTHQFRAIPENVQKQLWAKREPLSDDEINKLAWKQNLWTDGMIEFSFVALAREVERAHGIGGSDAE